MAAPHGNYNIIGLPAFGFFIVESWMWMSTGHESSEKWSAWEDGLLSLYHKGPKSWLTMECSLSMHLKIS